MLYLFKVFFSWNIWEQFFHLKWWVTQHLGHRCSWNMAGLHHLNVLLKDRGRVVRPIIASEKEIKSATPLLQTQAAKYFLEELLWENSANGIGEKKSSLGHRQHILGMSLLWFEARLIDYSQIYGCLPVELHSVSPLAFVLFALWSQS